MLRFYPAKNVILLNWTTVRHYEQARSPRGSGLSPAATSCLQRENPSYLSFEFRQHLPLHLYSRYRAGRALYLSRDYLVAWLNNLKGKVLDIVLAN